MSHQRRKKGEKLKTPYLRELIIYVSKPVEWQFEVLVKSGTVSVTFRLLLQTQMENTTDMVKVEERRGRKCKICSNFRLNGGISDTRWDAGIRPIAMEMRYGRLQTRRSTCSRHFFFSPARSAANDLTHRLTLQKAEPGNPSCAKAAELHFATPNLECRGKPTSQ